MTPTSLSSTFSLVVILILLSGLINAQNLIEQEFSHELNLGISDIIEQDDGGLVISAYGSPSSLDSVIAMMVKTNAALEVEWVKRYKTLFKDDFSCMRRLSDGNYLVGGAQRQNFSDQNGAGVFKMDGDGEVLWHKVYGESGDYRMLEVFEEQDSSLTMFIRHGVSNQPTKIIATDASGNLQSARAYMLDNYGVFAEAVTAGPNGVYYMVGNRLDLQTSLYNLFVCAIDATSMLWYKRLEIGRSASSYNVMFTDDEKIVLCGNVLDSLVPTTQNPVVISLDTDGTLLWGKEYQQADPLGEWVGDIVETSGGYRITGQLSTLDSTKALVFEVDATGAVNWAKTYGNQNYQSGVRSRNLSNGMMLIHSSTTEGQELILADSEGVSACSHEEVELAVSALAIPTTSLSPTTGNTVITDNSPPYTISEETVMVSMLCEEVVNLPKESLEPEVLIFPNPFNNEFTIELGSHLGSFKGACIYNLYGQTVWQQDGDLMYSTKVDLSSQPGGIYILELLGDVNSVKSSIVKQ